MSEALLAECQGDIGCQSPGRKVRAFLFSNVGFYLSFCIFLAFPRWFGRGLQSIGG